MKYVQAELLDDVVGSYDQTKTTIQGRCYSKTVDGKTALGPPLNKFVDVFTDAGVAVVANNTYLTTNGRIFILGAEAGAATPLLLYTINYSTGATSYVGRVNIILPDVAATTTTYRSIKAVDTGTTGWKVFITTTGSVAINGGTMLVNNLALADFVQVGFPSIAFATGDDQKAVYFLQDPSNLGSLHTNSNIASAGSCLDSANNRLYVHNGVAATNQYYVFSTNTAPTYTTYAITGTEATNTINHAGHPFVNGDQVTFTALTGGAGLVVGNTYFVVGSVAGVSYQVSATNGGAAINFTTDISAGTVGRGFGQTGSNFVHKTGNLPALTGTLLLTDSEDFAQPTSTGNVSIDGFDCVFFSTTTNLYLGRLSELTSGATSWPSLATVNLLGTANQIVTPAATNAAWSNVLQKAVYSTGLVFVMKSFVNNQITHIFGGTNNKYFEGLVANEVVELQPAAAVTCMDLEQGWLAIANTTVGQRGLMLADIYSDALFDYSYLVTKVLDSPQAVYKFITTVDALYDYTGSLECYYRTSGFGSISGGWTAIPFAELLDAYSTGSQVQFKLSFATLGLDTSIPAQLCDFFLGCESLTDNSKYWELSVDDSDNGNPSRSAFRLKLAYSSSVPTLRFTAYDLSDVLLVDHNTSANAARFEYSTNSGVSWNAVGTIPNTVGTLVRYTFASPPGVDIRPSLKEL
jgi:hypothetical protein